MRKIGPAPSKTSIGNGENILIDTAGQPALLARAAEALLAEGRSIRFSAAGNSMYPTILAGDTLIVEPCAPDRLSIGDIVLCRQDDRLLAHRVIRIDGRAMGDALRFLLRGDFRSHPDPPVDGSRILGKIVALERDNKTISPRGCVRRVAARGCWLASRVKQLLPL